MTNRYTVMISTPSTGVWKVAGGTYPSFKAAFTAALDYNNDSARLEDGKVASVEEGEAYGIFCPYIPGND